MNQQQALVAKSLSGQTSAGGPGKIQSQGISMNSKTNTYQMNKVALDINKPVQKKYAHFLFLNLIL